MNEFTFTLYRRSGWQPRVDVYQRNHGWLVKVELAGVQQEDTRIEVQNDTLIIEGQRRDWCVPLANESLSMEISYDWFKRTIRLPGPVTVDHSRTEYRDGMLLIYLENKS